jgi:hypothetical protein
MVATVIIIIRGDPLDVLAGDQRQQRHCLAGDGVRIHRLGTGPLNAAPIATASPTRASTSCSRAAVSSQALSGLPGCGPESGHHILAVGHDCGDPADRRHQRSDGVLDGDLPRRLEMERIDSPPARPRAISSRSPKDR